jgi:serine/threonine protein kinase
VGHYAAQVLEGLQYLHAEGIIHRDIKGDNILIDSTSDVKLADFGLSQNLSLVKQDDIAGTPYWMAPEIINMSGASYTSDIWSVGCMVIELLSGKPPYCDFAPHTALYKIAMDLHPPIPPGCSPAVEDFLLLCLKKEPGLRPSATQLLQHPWIVESMRIFSERSRTSSPMVHQSTFAPSVRISDQILLNFTSHL